MSNASIDEKPILVLGATGKTGRRIVQRLRDQGYAVRAGSRSATPAFDWDREDTWAECIAGAGAVYINYAPDLAMPGAPDAIRRLTELARQAEVARLVLLSGRGEAEAQRCEQIVASSGIDWTVVRSSWFSQNFSEGAFLEMVQAGRITLPAGDVGEPFVDLDDVADVAVAALTEAGHSGEIYEVTGPRLLTFADASAELSAAIGKPVDYVQVPHDAFMAEVSDAGAPQDVVWMLDYLFATVLDGRNAALSDGVQRALGRPPRDFAEYAASAARSGVFEASTR